MKKRILSLLLILSLVLTGDIQITSAEVTYVESVSGLTVKKYPDMTVELNWEKSSYIVNNLILRSQKKEGPYECAGIVSNVKSYFDYNVKRGKTYFYKVINFQGDLTEEVLDCEAEPVQITMDYLTQPVITAKKGKSKGQKYVEITLKEYTGKHIEIYMKDLGKYKKLDIKSGLGATVRKKYRFQYKIGGMTLYFKARTYQKINGKRRYSSYSETVKVKI